MMTEEQYWIPDETVTIHLADGKTRNTMLVAKSKSGLSGLAVDGEETILIVFVDDK